MTDWALATTFPNCERRVAEDLSKRNLQFHLIKRRLLVAYRGKLVERLIPAFPRYIFIPFSKCWEVAREIAGVIGLVMFEDRPAKIRETVIDKLVSACVDEVLKEDPKIPSSKFRFGDEVIIVSLDSTLSQIGRYHHSDECGRAIVLLEWMGRSVFVNVHEGDLRLRANKIQRKLRRRRARQHRIRCHFYGASGAALRSHALAA